MISFAKTLCASAIAVVVSMAAAAQPLQKIAIGLASSSIPGGSARIAKQMGLFEKHGLDATVTPMENDAVAVAGLISGSLNFATTSGNQLVVAQARGQDVVAIRAVYTIFPAVLVLSKPAIGSLRVRPDSPVAERWKALDGLVIATPGSTSSYSAVLAPAREAGAKVRFVYMAQTAMNAALEAGAVQGFIASSPFYAQPVLRDTGAIWISGLNGEFNNAPQKASILSTTRKFAAQNPDITARVLRAYADLSDAVTHRPDEVKAAIAQLFPTLSAPTLDLIFNNEARGFVGAPETVADMAKEIAFAKASGVDIPRIDQLDPKTMTLD